MNFDYDFMDSIRIDAPSSLVDEFGRMDFKLEIPTNRFETPKRNDSHKQNYYINKNSK